MLPVFIQGDDLHGDMPRRRILLELTQHRPTQHVGQEDVQRDGSGLILARQRQRIGAAHGDQYLHSVVMHQINQNARIVRIVFHDQQHGVVWFQAVAVVRHLSRSAARPAASGWAAATWIVVTGAASIAGARAVDGPT